MARLISTEAEFNDWDPEIDPDVDIDGNLIADLKKRKLIDALDAGLLSYRYGV